MRRNTYTRKELHEMVWRSPISSLAKQLNVSGYELRKVCKEVSIPVPVRGYWRMIKANKRVQVIPLDTNYNGTDVIFIIARDQKINKL